MQKEDDYDEMERFAEEEFGGTGRMSIGDGDEEVRHANRSTTSLLSAVSISVRWTRVLTGFV